MWYGLERANGKTTLIEMMRKVLGPYFIQADKEVFLKVDGRKGGNSSFLAELKGKRMAVFSETEIDDKLNEGQIKALTGGDRIKAKPLYRDLIEYTNLAKYIISSNHKPNSHTNSEAWWRRVIMIPFRCRFVENPTKNHKRLKDITFKEKHLNDSQILNAFLNQLVIGTIKTYTQNNISIPKCVSDTTSEYQMEQDIYAKFVNETLETSNKVNSDWYIPAKELYLNFVDWTKEEGIKVVSNIVFGENIKKILQQQKKTAGIRYLNCKFKLTEINTNNNFVYPVNLTNLLKQ